jgi:hypothetical protein
MALRLKYLLLFLVVNVSVCDGGFDISCDCCSSSTVVVDGSFVWTTLNDNDSSNERTIRNKIVSEDQLDVVDSVSLLVVLVFIEGMTWITLSITIKHSSSSIRDH